MVAAVELVDLAASATSLIATAVILVNNLRGNDAEPWLIGPSGTLQGYKFAMLMVGVLGVTSVSGEYGTGMIRSTFAAVPKRWPVLVAKTVVTSVVVMVSSAVANLVALPGGSGRARRAGELPERPGSGAGRRRHRGPDDPYRAAQATTSGLADGAVAECDEAIREAEQQAGVAVRTMQGRDSQPHRSCSGVVRP